jgi:hypothetical protein
MWYKVLNVNIEYDINQHDTGATMTIIMRCYVKSHNDLFSSKTLFVA